MGRNAQETSCYGKLMSSQTLQLSEKFWETVVRASGKEEFETCIVLFPAWQCYLKKTVKSRLRNAGLFPPIPGNVQKSICSFSETLELGTRRRPWLLHSHTLLFAISGSYLPLEVPKSPQSLTSSKHQEIYVDLFHNAFAQTSALGQRHESEYHSSFNPQYTKVQNVGKWTVAR